MAGKSDSGSSDEVKDGGLKKGPWSAEEDRKLIDYIKKHGYGRWRTLPKNAGLKRCGKSCRLRWTNYLRPDIKRGSFTSEEEDTIIHLHSILGNKWSSIAARLPGRTDNEIKNYWNTHIKKRLYKMGIDPVTHTPCDVAPLEQLSPFITHNLDLLRMLGSDINLSTYAATHLFPRTKTQQLVSPQNPNNSSDELFQSHIQSLISTHQLQTQTQTQTLNQNLSPNPNPFASSRDCDVSNSWHSENPIAHSGDFFGSFQSMVEADKTYHDTKYDDVATSMPGLIGTVDSSSIARYRDGCSIGTEEERGNSYRSRSGSFIFDMENESYVNSIM